MQMGLLLGDEAVAQAAIDAGIRGAFSYPGTPATEIFEYILERGGKPEFGSIEAPPTLTPPNLLRLSVGLEHVDDLLKDLEQALRRI